MSEDEPAAVHRFEPDRDEVRRHAGQQRLGILAAVDAALLRHDEVIPVIVDSADRSDACAAVAELLGVGEVEATAVLDLQWGRMTRAERGRAADDRLRQEQDLAN